MMKRLLMRYLDPERRALKFTYKAQYYDCWFDKPIRDVQTTPSRLMRASDAGQVKGFKVSIQSVLNDEYMSPYSFEDFFEFLKKEHSEENLEFFRDIQSYSYAAAPIYNNLSRDDSLLTLTHPSPPLENSAPMLMPSDAVAQLFDNEFARQGAVSRRGSGGMTTAAADSHPSPPASPGTESEKQPANCGRLEESMRALRADMERIISTYLLQDSAKEINLPDVLRKRILNEVRENNNLHPDLFKGAIENVTTMMRLSSFPNFLKQALLVDPRPPLTKKLTIEQKVNFAGFPKMAVC